MVPEADGKRQAGGAGQPSKVTTFQSIKTYTYVSEKKSWDNAAAACELIDAKLVSVTTYKEQKKLAEFIRMSYPSGGDFWIGSKKTGDANAEWKWLSGEPIPNDADFKWHNPTTDKTETGCLLLHPGVSGFCNHNACSAELPYVCEHIN